MAGLSKIGVNLNGAPNLLKVPLKMTSREIASFLLAASVAILVPNISWSACYKEIHMTGIAFFHDPERPPRVELFDLGNTNRFRDYDLCQAKLVYFSIKNGNPEKLKEDPTSGRLIYVSVDRESDWLKETWYMCSHGEFICD